MNLKIVTGVIALFMFVGAVGLATAQDTTKTTHKKTRTLTGCLQKGDDSTVLPRKTAVLVRLFECERFGTDAQIPTE
jgi:hypothetical protein